MWITGRFFAVRRAKDVENPAWKAVAGPAGHSCALGKFLRWAYKVSLDKRERGCL